MGEAWHCAITKPNQERRAAVELAKQDFEVYFPIMSAKPMFPGYLFVKFDRDKDNWGVIQNTRGCTGLIKTGFLPATVPQYAIEAIMAYRPPQESTQSQTIFTRDQPVKIVEGPLAGLSGLFVENRRKRVYALLEVMGRTVKVPTASIVAA